MFWQIGAEKADDWTALSRDLLPPLFRFYDQVGIRHVRASKQYEAEAIRDHLANIVQELAWKRTWIARERLLEASRRCLALGEETLPLCTGHGDLTKTNLLVGADGRTILFDWEHARELPIAAEWVKLVCQHPPLLEHLAPELQRRTEDPSAMPPSRQFLLATLDRLTGLAHSTRIASGSAARRARKAGFWIPLASRLIEALD